jgi:hypothetical protein
MRYYAMAYGSTAQLAQTLRRSERTVKDWMSGAARVPWWVPEILRLKKMEHDSMVYQMTGYQPAARLGVLDAGTVVDAGQRFRPPTPTPAAADGLIRLHG